MDRYAGKVAVITGGNSGIGLATARRLKQEGARGVIVGRDAATLAAPRGSSASLPSKRTSAELLKSTACTPRLRPRWVRSTSIPHLNDGASIILNSCTVTPKGWPGIAVYSATKAAVRSLARSFAAESDPYHPLG